MSLYFCVALYTIKALFFIFIFKPFLVQQFSANHNETHAQLHVSSHVLDLVGIKIKCMNRYTTETNLAFDDVSMITTSESVSTSVAMSEASFPIFCRFHDFFFGTYSTQQLCEGVKRIKFNQTRFHPSLNSARMVIWMSVKKIQLKTYF